MALELAINGVAGRMGRRIAQLAADAGHRVVAAFDSPQHSGTSLASLIGDKRQTAIIGSNYNGGAAVLIDFSLPAGFEARLRECMQSRTPFVSGTTGLSDAQKAMLDTAAGQIAVLWAPNMSLGVNLMISLVRQCAKALPREYDIEITEMHHRRKVDAPSGTALALLESVCQGNGSDAASSVRHGREGNTGERSPGEIGMHSLRGGDVVGDHTVIFAAEGERIELTHRASSRDTFAAGALRAAEWIAGRAPGRYTMAQVLGL